MLAGYQPDKGADGAAGEAMPVTDLDRQGERGERGDSAQAPQSAHYWGELAVRGHRLDLGVQAIAACGGDQQRVVVGLERQLGRGILETLMTQPRVVPAGPGGAVVVDDPVPEQQFG